MPTATAPKIFVPKPRRSQMGYGATHTLATIQIDKRTVVYEYNDGVAGYPWLPLTLSVHDGLEHTSSLGLAKLLPKRTVKGRPIVRAGMACGGALDELKITGTIEEQALIARAIQVFFHGESDRQLRSALRGIYRRLAANVLADQPTEPAVPVVPIADDPATQGILAAALTWLYETPQPSNADLDCYPDREAPALTVATDRRLSVSAGEKSVLGHGTAVLPWISVQVAERTTPLDELLNGLLPGEIDSLADVVRSLGYEVASTVGEAGASHGGIRLARMAHPTILAAQNYTWLHQCPDHEATSDVGKYICCDWIERAKAAAILPAWPVPIA